MENAKYILKTMVSLDKLEISSEDAENLLERECDVGANILKPTTIQNCIEYLNKNNKKGPEALKYIQTELNKYETNSAIAFSQFDQNSINPF